MDASRVAVVTGAGSGIGRAAARALAGAGFQVVLAGRRREALEETLKSWDTAECGLVVPTDVSVPEEVDALFARTLAKWGRVDVLFNNAGANCAAAKVEDIPWDDWRRVIDVNLTGTFLCTQTAVRHMKSQQPAGGRIINNGSISAHVPRPWSAAYTASKHAVTGLTRAIGLDCRPYGIVCSQIDIGNAATEMTRRMADGVRQADGSLAAEPTIDVEHVARTVVYLASLPLDVNVPFMTIMAAKMPYLGRG